MSIIILIDNNKMKILDLLEIIFSISNVSYLNLRRRWRWRWGWDDKNKIIYMNSRFFFAYLWMDRGKKEKTIGNEKIDKRNNR